MNGKTVAVFSGLVLAMYCQSRSKEITTMSAIAAGNAIVTMDSKGPLPAGAKELGRFRGRVWGEAPWAEILAPANTAVIWDLAYLDDSTFRAGTQGLKKAEISEVLKKRVKERDQILGYMGDDLGNEAGQLGAWECAASAADSNTAEAADWKRRGELAFNIHRQVYFTGRRIEHSVLDIGRLLEIRNSLESLESELEARPDCLPDWSTYLQARGGLKTASLASLATVSATLGSPGHPSGIAHDYMDRIAYYQPFHPLVPDQIDYCGSEKEKYGKGELVPRTPEELKREAKILHPPVIFLNSRDWSLSSVLLTKAQRNRLIDGLVAAGGCAAAAYLEEVILTRLEFLAVLGGFLEEPPSTLDPKSKAILEGVYAVEMKSLGTMVIWRRGKPDRVQEQGWIGSLAARLKLLRQFSDKGGIAFTADLAKRVMPLADTLERNL